MGNTFNKVTWRPAAAAALNSFGIKSKSTINSSDNNQADIPAKSDNLSNEEEKDKDNRDTKENNNNNNNDKEEIFKDNEHCDNDGINNDSGKELNDDDDNDDLIGDEIKDRQAKRGRRQSVAAESFDPEKEDNDDGLVIHSKTDVQRKRLVEAIKNIFLFKSLDDEQRARVIDSMREVIVKPNQKIIKQGEDGDDFYIIEKGTYDIYMNNKKVSQYKETGFFGELALMYNTPRAATISAATNGILWAMDRVTFRKIVLKNAFLKRRMYEGLLETVPLLGELSSYDRTNVADALISRVFKDGDMILEQGQQGQEMFFIEEGLVQVVRDQKDGSKPKEINRLKKGDYFGEVALLIKEPRLASVYAVGKTKVAVLDIKSFERLMGPCVNLMKKNLPKYRSQLKEILGSKADKIIPELSAKK